MRVVRGFKMLARCSKCDFWILGEISDRYMWSKNFRRNIFGRKFLAKKSKTYFSRSKHFRKMFDEKVNENRKFQNFMFSPKKSKF